MNWFYKIAKEMLLVENVDDKAFLSQLFIAMYPELPEPKKNSKKRREKLSEKR